MSWAKALVEVGLAGLSEKKAVRGTLCEEVFQLMPSPHVKHLVVVSKFKCRVILHAFNVKDVKDKYLQSSVYLI